MKRVWCFFFGHKWVYKDIKFKVNSKQIPLRQCLNCGKIEYIHGSV